MRAAYILLLALIGMSPVLLVVDGPMIHALLVAYAAVAVALVGVRIRPGEAAHLASLFRPIAIIAVVPAVWMVVQMIPLPIKSWAHPIWSDAETALGTPITGSITIDPGATVVAICRYFSAVGTLFVAAAVAIDRRRAGRILVVLVAATTVAAVLQIINSLGGFDFLSPTIKAGITEPAAALTALGIVMATAAVIRALEHYERREPFKVEIVLSVAALSVCVLSLVIFAPAQISLAAASGFVTLAILMVIRRLGLGPWAADAIATMAIVIVIIIAIAVAQKFVGPGDAMLRYASHAQGSLIDISGRIVAETRWLGTGAGTFGALLPIYGDPSANPLDISAPTAVAQISVELGRPMLVAILIIAISLLVMLSRGALQRGRDAFYPAAGAGCMVVLMLEAFCDASLLNTAVLICAAAALGLALAQRVSRTQ